jgi:hypothetical protein
MGRRRGGAVRVAYVPGPCRTDGLRLNTPLMLYISTVLFVYTVIGGWHGTPGTRAERIGPAHARVAARADERTSDAALACMRPGRRASRTSRSCAGSSGCGRRGRCGRRSPVTPRISRSATVIWQRSGRSSRGRRWTRARPRDDRSGAGAPARPWVEAKVATPSVDRSLATRGFPSLPSRLSLLRIKKQKSEMPDDGRETFKCHVSLGTERCAGS